MSLVDNTLLFCHCGLYARDHGHTGYTYLSICCSEVPTLAPGEPSRPDPTLLHLEESAQRRHENRGQPAAIGSPRRLHPAHADPPRATAGDTNRPTPSAAPGKDHTSGGVLGYRGCCPPARYPSRTLPLCTFLCRSHPTHCTFKTTIKLLKTTPHLSLTSPVLLC